MNATRNISNKETFVTSLAGESRFSPNLIINNAKIGKKDQIQKKKLLFLFSVLISFSIGTNLRKDRISDPSHAISRRR